MLSSGIIDLAVGIIFVFGVTAAISSVATELIARILGLRGAYLLLGLRELLDSQDTTVDLGDAKLDFEKARALIKHAPAPRQAAPPRMPPHRPPARVFRARCQQPARCWAVPSCEIREYPAR